MEIIQEAIENARANGVTNAESIVGKSEEEIPRLIAQGIKVDVVVVDPPRKGCEESLFKALAEIKPRRIVYVSCNPATLARNLGVLDGLGYKTVELQPIDMFPQISYVECDARIERNSLL